MLRLFVYIRATRRSGFPLSFLFLANPFSILRALAAARSAADEISHGPHQWFCIPAFTVLGTVALGMSVVDSLYSGYGETSGAGVRQGRQGPLETGGNVYMDREFPLLDRIIRVSVRPAVPEP